jgi:hypothetical protein
MYLGKANKAKICLFWIKNSLSESVSQVPGQEPRCTGLIGYPIKKLKIFSQKPKCHYHSKLKDALQTTKQI